MADAYSHDFELYQELSPATVLVSGTVKNLSGTPLVRKVIVFNENNPGDRAETESLSSGAFSVRVPGANDTKFFVIAIGISGENNTVLGHIVKGA